LTHCALLLKKHTPKTWPCMLGSMWGLISDANVERDVTAF
jgi:hypothetical protein